MADGVWKGVYPQVFGRSRQLSLNKFLDPSAPFMRKVDNEKDKREKKREKKIMSFQWPLTSLPVGRPNADQLERRTLVPIVQLFQLLKRKRWRVCITYNFDYFRKFDKQFESSTDFPIILLGFRKDILDIYPLLGSVNVGKIIFQNVCLKESKGKTSHW